ncbi:uncharacterized protein LOC143620122 [Bidens hawaiensis]|uniref:uncharacterized protein LOC143620122 n=1 Tax=Bidens hawaiensis TaxID=980011 RepID=UPI00404A986F
MECNQIYDESKELNYIKFPSKFVWKKEGKCWERRKLGFSIGRIHSVSPALGEAYFLRILLNKVKGPTSFKDIRTVNGVVFPTFRDACYECGLLDDDMEYTEAIKEASNSGSGGSKKFQRALKSTDLSLTEEQIKNLTLYEIEKLLLRNASTLRNLETMPFPDEHSVSTSNNLLINEELNYEPQDLQNEYDNLFVSLTEEQRCIFLEITKAVEINKGGVFFVYGYGGTGKTFLWKTLSASIRSKDQIVLNVASSGIASLLLTGGRTAHSRFQISNEDSTCTIKPGTDDAQLVSEARLIIWDEAPMIHKHAFEALDRTLKDIPNFVFGGDFRQILPVVQNGSRQDIVNSSISSSYLWSECKVLRLTKNMRLNVVGDSTNMEQTKLFAQWLLDLGEGKVGGTNDGEAIIEIPDDLLINDSLDPVSELINFVYPSILSNYMQPNFFEERALLAPTNELVQEINVRLLSMFPGDKKEYLSSDSICQEEYLNENFDESLYSPDILNGLKISGLLNHKLVLKVGVPVMLLRNLDQKGCGYEDKTDWGSELFSKSNHLFCEVRYPKSKPKSQLLTVQMTKCQKRLAA